MKARTWLLVALIVVAAVVLAAVFLRSPDGTTRSELKIGVILPLTGEAAYLGTSVRNGMELAAPEAAKRLAEKGLTLSLVYEDSADQVKNAVSAYNKLVTVDRAEILVCVSGGWKALIPLADQQDRVLFCTVVSPSKVAAQSPWAFRFFISADSDASLMAEFAAKRLRLGEVAVLYVNDEFGNSYKEVFTKHFESVGGKVVSAEGFSPADTDFRPILTRIKGANPDAVYLLAYGNNMALAARQMRELGIDVPLLSIGTISQPDIMKQAGQAVEGAYYTTTRFNTFSPETPQLKRFVEAYTAKYQQPPVFFEVFGYDTVNLLAAAAAKAGPSPEAVRDALLALKGYKGAAGDISFSQEGEATFPVVVRQIKNGQLVDVGWSRPEN